jgi:hypothetical protein
LLLSARSVSGHGVFANVHSIQRLKTTGGKAPSDGCDAARANALVRVPYTARYDFYAQP